MDFKTQLAASLAPSAGMEAGALEAMLETPSDTAMGDMALPCFKLAKTLRKAPPAIAAQIKDSAELPGFISKCEAVGGYLNFFIDKAQLAKETLAAALAAGDKYGAAEDGAGRVVCIDYSSINIAKPFHMGHLSTTAIGNSLYRIYNFLGYKSVGINHLGDWGTQFGKLIVAYKLWGDKEDIEARGVTALYQIYVKYNTEAASDKTLDDQARAWFKKIEDGDAEALELFEWFKAITLKEVARVYDMLGVKFDSYAGESFYNDKMGRVIDECREKGLLTVDNGASIVAFPEEDNMPPCLLLKADGATLYATRDIAAAIYRKEHYDFYKCLYVVAYQQNLHFKQWFKVVSMMGYEWYAQLEHVAFGMVSMEDGAMSTRLGKVIFLEDVLNRSIEKCAERIREKSPDLEDVSGVARDVGVGAIIFSTLSSGRIKDIVFSWDRALNFDGETGPYCQYTHARCCSVLRKAGGLPGGDIDYAALDDAPAQAVIKLIADFPDTIKRACAANEPYMIARNTVELAKAYNKFYFENRILDAPENVRNARLALTECVRATVKNGLYLLGINAPERM